MVDNTNGRGAIIYHKGGKETIETLVCRDIPHLNLQKYVIFVLDFFCLFANTLFASQRFGVKGDFKIK